MQNNMLRSDSKYAHNLNDPANIIRYLNDARYGTSANTYMQINSVLNSIRNENIKQLIKINQLLVAYSPSNPNPEVITEIKALHILTAGSNTRTIKSQFDSIKKTFKQGNAPTEGLSKHIHELREAVLTAFHNLVNGENTQIYTAIGAVIPDKNINIGQ
jgi:hypothetical protein